MKLQCVENGGMFCKSAIYNSNLYINTKWKFLLVQTTIKIINIGFINNRLRWGKIRIIVVGNEHPNVIALLPQMPHLVYFHVCHLFVIMSLLHRLWRFFHSMTLRWLIMNGIPLRKDKFCWLLTKCIIIQSNFYQYIIFITIFPFFRLSSDIRKRGRVIINCENTVASIEVATSRGFE